MSLILDGGNGITFPSGSGTQAAPSKVLQVVQGTLSGSTSTSSSSFTSTGLTASITPLFSTSKILIFVSLVGSYTVSSGNEMFTTIYRGSTNIAPAGTIQSFSDLYCASSNALSNISYAYLDSPATTSSTSYTIYFYSGVSGAVRINANGQTSFITLMEIAQ